MAFKYEEVFIGGSGGLLLYAVMAAILAVCRPIEDRIVDVLVPTAAKNKVVAPTADPKKHDVASKGAAEDDGPSVMQRVTGVFKGAESEDGAGSKPVKGQQGLVDSWKAFVEQAKARAVEAEKKWTEEFPEGRRTIKIKSNDLKKSDSLLSPYVGVIVLSDYQVYGPNTGRKMVIDAIEMRLRYLQGVGGKPGEREKAEAELREAKKKSLLMFMEREYELQFAPEDGTWRFIEGTNKLIGRDESGDPDIGKTSRMSDTKAVEQMFP